MRRGERERESQPGERTILAAAAAGRSSDWPKTDAPTDGQTDGERRGRGERCRHPRRKEGRNGGTSGRRWDEEGRKEGSQCINNITSSEAGSPPSKPTNHLPGERATDSGPFSLEIRACRRRRRRRVTACHFDCPARQVCRCGSSEGVAEGEGGSEAVTKEGGKVNEDCHPRGRGRGRQEGVKRTEGE